MKYLRRFNENINSSEIDAICEKYRLRDYIINEDGTVDVDDHVNIYEKDLDTLPLKFGKVTGDFWCNRNELISLYGAPYYVGKGFYCSDNQLISLEHAPKYVGGIFSCNDNQLTSLKYAPEYVGDSFYCASNRIKSMKGLPKKIRYNLDFKFNKIKNIDYLPNYFNKISISENPIFSILELFISYDSCGVISDKEPLFDFNEREIIQNDILLIDRLVEFLEDIGKPKSKEELYNLLKNDYEIR